MSKLEKYRGQSIAAYPLFNNCLGLIMRKITSCLNRKPDFCDLLSPLLYCHQEPVTLIQKCCQSIDPSSTDPTVLSFSLSYFKHQLTLFLLPFICLSVTFRHQSEFPTSAFYLSIAYAFPSCCPVRISQRLLLLSNIGLQFVLMQLQQRNNIPQKLYEEVDI